MNHYNINKTKLDSFLNKHKVKDGQEFTHTIFGGQYGKYNISDVSYHQFLNLYKKLVFSNNSELYIVERHNGKEVGPLVIDIDYWANKEYNERQYRQDHIEKLIGISTKIINKYMDFSNYDGESEIIVMEKDGPSYKDGKYKDGFHILFPLAFNITNRYFLLNKIKKKAEKMDIFSDINYSDDGYDTIFDKRVIYSNGLTMYGSRKKDSKMYALTSMYNFNAEQTELKYDSDEMVYVCSLRIYNAQDEVPMKERYINNKKISAKLEEIKKTENPMKSMYTKRNNVSSSSNTNEDKNESQNADSKINNIKKKIRNENQRERKEK